MKNLITKSANISIIALVIFIYGCGSDPVTAPVAAKITVNGKFQDPFGTPYALKTVIIGSQTTTTDNNGVFTINNVTTPYDVFLLTYATTAVVLKGLTVSKPQIGGFIGGALSSSMTVQIPTVVPGSKATVLFADTSSNSNVNGTGTIYEGSSNVNFNLGGPNGNIISGIVYVLQYTQNAAGVITGYTKFGQQGVTITLGTNPTITFTPPQLTTDPGESNVSGAVNAPVGYAGVSADLRLNFGAKNNIQNDGMNLQIINNSAFSFVVPSGLPSTLKLSIEARSTNPSSHKILSVTPGTSNAVINLEQSPVLTSPPNGAVDIDTNSLFTYNQGSGTGINIVVMYNFGSSFTIYTKDNSVKIPNLAAYGDPIGAMVQYDWFVARVNEFNSMDAFCSSFYKTNPMFNSSVISGMSGFTTKP